LWLGCFAGRRLRLPRHCWRTARSNQFVFYVGGALPAVVGILRQAPDDGVLQRRRGEGFNAGDGCGFFFEDGGGHAELALARKSALARQHFVEERAQREDVAAAVDFFAFDLFGRHVLESADNRAFLSDRAFCMDVTAVRVARLALGVAARAKPKSRSFAPDLVSMTLPGFRSRWMIPLRWALSRASAISRPIFRTWSRGRWPFCSDRGGIGLRGVP